VVGVAFAVVLKRVAVLVNVPAVQLDDQPVPGEEHVQHSAVEREVDLGLGEPVFVDEVQEVVLEA
jgi:hypothetical protein